MLLYLFLSYLKGMNLSRKNTPHFSNLNVHHNHLGSLLKYKLLSSTSKVFDLVSLGRAQKFVFLESLEMMVMVMV